MDIVSVSKLLSYVLRHHPEKANVKLDNDGFVYVADLLDGLEKRKALRLRPNDLNLIMTQGDKQRLEYNVDRTMIRAIQGHTVKVNIKYKILAPLPQYVYHGTVERFIPGISNSGICKMTRQHVHCSLDIDTAWHNAERRKHNVPTVLEISTQDVMHAGFTFYQASNGVVLVDHVPFDCIRNMMVKKIVDTSVFNKKDAPCL